MIVFCIVCAYVCLIVCMCCLVVCFSGYELNNAEVDVLLLLRWVALDAIVVFLYEEPLLQAAFVGIVIAISLCFYCIHIPNPYQQQQQRQQRYQLVAARDSRDVRMLNVAGSCALVILMFCAVLLDQYVSVNLLCSSR